MDRFRMQYGVTAALVWVLIAGGAVNAQQATHAFVNARIIPIAGPAIERGTLVIRGTTILAIGPEGTAVPPASALVKLVLRALIESSTRTSG